MNPFNWQSTPSALPPARAKKLSRPSLGPLKNGLYGLSKRPGDMPIEPRRSEIDWGKSQKIRQVAIGALKRAMK